MLRTLLNWKRFLVRNAKVLLLVGSVTLFCFVSIASRGSLLQNLRLLADEKFFRTEASTASPRSQLLAERSDVAGSVGQRLRKVQPVQSSDLREDRTESSVTFRGRQKQQLSRKAKGEEKTRPDRESKTKARERDALGKNNRPAEKLNVKDERRVGRTKSPEKQNSQNVDDKPRTHSEDLVVKNVRDENALEKISSYKIDRGGEKARLSIKSTEKQGENQNKNVESKRKSGESKSINQSKNGSGTKTDPVREKKEEKPGGVRSNSKERNLPRMRQISMEKAISRFRYKASKECVNKCPEVDESGAEEDEVTNFSLCPLTEQNKWSNALQNARANLTRILADDEYVYPYEREYLSYPKARESTDLPSAKRSRVVFPVQTCRLGDTLAGRLDVVDGAGRPRASGGDEVRAWVGATHSPTGSAIRSMFPRVMAPVTDLNNGSYRIDVPCLWAGRSRLILIIRYPREFLRMVVETVRGGISRFIGARFQKGGAVEEVPCLPTPNIPGRPCICNLTSANGGSPFYCGRPFDQRITCDDWTVSGTLTRVTPGDMARALGKFVMKRTDARVPTQHLVFVTEPGSPESKEIAGDQNSEDMKDRKEGYTTGEDKSLPPHLFVRSPPEKCITMKPTITWGSERPTGYWLNEYGTWVSLLCTEPPMTVAWMRACLRNSNTWVIGDSNGVRLYYKIADGSDLKRLDYGPMPFFDVLAKSNRQENINIHYTPHEHPLYVTKTWKQLDVSYVGVPQKIDAIPSSGRQFLLVHYFLHLTPVHLGLAQSRLLAARDAILRLLARNPQAMVGVRGPHTVALNHEYDIAIGGDSLARHLVAIIHDVFADVRDRVFFLDGWEMSLSLESAGIHPDGAVTNEMVRKFYSFVCDERVGASPDGDR